MDKTWIVVAESARARILEARSRVAPLTEVLELEHPESRMKGRDLITDRPGTTHDRAGEGQRAMERANPHVHEQELFARDIAEQLERGRVTGRYASLVVIASPSFLGTLRRNLDEKTGRLISRSLDKDLVDEDEATIREYLFG